MRQFQWEMKTKIGSLYLVASENGLSGAFWKKQNIPVVQILKKQDKVLRLIAKTAAQLEEYLKGQRKTFDLTLDFQGTDFQNQVWRELLKIPYGETASYRDIARKIQNGNAVRAVGTANGKNPLSIIIPCHRVIASNGTLAGYAGGLEKKTLLLALERENQLKDFSSTD